MKLVGTPLTLPTLYTLCLAVQIYVAFPLGHLQRSRGGSPGDFSDIGGLLQVMFLLPGMGVTGGTFCAAAILSLALWTVLLVYTIRAALKIPGARGAAALIMVVITVMSVVGAIITRKQSWPN